MVIFQLADGVGVGGGGVGVGGGGLGVGVIDGFGLGDGLGVVWTTVAVQPQGSWPIATQMLLRPGNGEGTSVGLKTR